ncbi:GFA family protein [Cupriavidus gilardii]|uniref:GFA family protein n=1 Tax=Cupriavidus gilardii TaxID=82541 RepID=UPI001572BE5E|nr:GFA family protein [Cupriavidus gilardii]NSX03672.1 GFA family protein [Cupriavidus gilardii]
MQYQGSCHCGRIAFEVEGEIEAVLSCNCSICQRRGHLLWFVPRERLRLKTPESDYSTYRFHSMKIAHHFCPVCGCGPFGEAIDPKGQPTAAVNARCLEGIDLDKLKVIPFDGRRL